MIAPTSIHFHTKHAEQGSFPLCVFLLGLVKLIATVLEFSLPNAEPVKTVELFEADLAV